MEPPGGCRPQDHGTCRVWAQEPLGPLGKRKTLAGGGLGTLVVQ